MRSRADEFEKAGAKLAIVGNGWPAMAKAFAERNGLPASVTLLTDPSLQSYVQAGLKRSALLTLGPRGWLPYLQTLRNGFRQGRLAGDPWQQGGAVVVAPGSRVLYRYISTQPADQPSVGSLLAPLRKAA
ncbi:MAG: AhpC/TSA family protein [Myxococcales bacterium]|nr:AhpC/TSA family protein [Myxococcales bacterium]